MRKENKNSNQATVKHNLSVNNTVLSFAHVDQKTNKHGNVNISNDTKYNMMTVSNKLGKMAQQAEIHDDTNEIRPWSMYNEVEPTCKLAEEIDTYDEFDVNEISPLIVHNEIECRYHMDNEQDTVLPDQGNKGNPIPGNSEGTLIMQSANKVQMTDSREEINRKETRDQSRNEQTIGPANHDSVNCERSNKIKISQLTPARSQYRNK